MLKTAARLTILLGMLVSSDQALAEPLYPEESNIRSRYELSSQNLYTDDTLTITRTIVSDENYPLSGLYFSENVASEFTLADFEVTLNGGSISVTHEIGGHPMFEGYGCHYWIVDDPDGSVQTEINPGDSLVLSVRLTCLTPGTYGLPMHTCTLYGNSLGFFATDNSQEISVLPAVDLTPPSEILDLEAF